MDEYRFPGKPLLGFSVNRLSRFVLDSVLERHDPRLLERPTASQLQLEPLRRRLRRQQWDALTEQDGNHSDFHAIHEPAFQETAEERTAAKEPDVLTRYRPEVGQH